MLPPNLDPHQFAYRRNNRSRDGIVIATSLLHTSLTPVHPTSVPHQSGVPFRLNIKTIQALGGGLNPSPCSFILGSTRQVVRMGSSAPQHRSPPPCVLSPLFPLKLIVGEEYRRRGGGVEQLHAITTSGSLTAERVSDQTSKFLASVHITEDLTWDRKKGTV